MPELPEVETVVRDLRPHLPGRRIVDVEIPRGDVIRGDPGAFRSDVRGRRLEAVRRRGKNVVLPLDDGATVVVNLGMTGRLLRRPDGSDSPPDHLAVSFGLSGGGHLLYDDVRRFGRLEVLDAPGWRRRSAELGPEPLDRELTGEGLHARLQRSRAPIRSWLLDQGRIAGVGNIYANEVLWRAEVHPRRPARSLGPGEAGAVLSSLREVLTAAIRRRGTTIRDFRDADGRPGEFASRLRVYGREGEACPRCGAGVERIVFGGRPAFVCSRCQDPPSGVTP